MQRESTKLVRAARDGQSLHATLVAKGDGELWLHCYRQFRGLAKYPDMDWMQILLKCNKSENLALATWDVAKYTGWTSDVCRAMWNDCASREGGVAERNTWACRLLSGVAWLPPLSLRETLQYAQHLRPLPAFVSRLECRKRYAVLRRHFRTPAENAAGWCIEADDTEVGAPTNMTCFVWRGEWVEIGQHKLEHIELDKLIRLMLWL